MDPLIAFEGEAEYLVVDTGLTQTLDPLAPLSNCERHCLPDGMVIVRQKQHQQQATSEACGSPTLRITEARAAQQHQHLSGFPVNARPIAKQQAELRSTYEGGVSKPNHPLNLGTASGLSNTDTSAQMVVKATPGSHSAGGESTVKSAMSIMHNYSSRSGSAASSDHHGGDPAAASSSGIADSSAGGFHCFQCKLQFISEPKAVAHFKSAHSRITCHHCRLLKFDTYNSYGRHVKESHIECPLCHALVKHRTALQKHLSRYHPDRSDRFKITCGEPDCASQFINLPELTIHLKVDHNLPIVAKTATVSSWEAAQQWIVAEELAHNVKFVVRNNYRSRESTVRKYWCYWNGLFQREKEMNQGNRSRLPQCVAFCTIDADHTRARYVIKACLSHYGHPVDTTTVRCSFSTCDQIGLINHHTNRNVRYFKPSGEDQITQQWLALLNTREKRDVLVCSRHFRPQDFDIDLISNRLVLKTSAVPGIFGDAANVNDPFSVCACEHSAEQCCVLRENDALRERVAALEAEAARLQHRLAKIEDGNFDLQSTQYRHMKQATAVERVVCTIDEASRSSSSQRSAAVEEEMPMKNVVVGSSVATAQNEIAIPH